MKHVRLSRVLGASALGLGLMAGWGAWVVLRDPVTRANATTFLDDLHISGPRTDLWREAQALAKRDAAADARAAFEAGDRRLLELATIGPYIPGTDETEYQALFDRFGGRLLSWGCAISSREEWTLRGAQEKYAARYNRELLRLAGVSGVGAK